MSPAEFARRRRALMRMMGKGSVAILPAAPARIRNRDVAYPYRQDSDFYYLSGFAEPNAVLVIAPGHVDGDFMVFCQREDPARELWDGKRLTPAGAVSQLGASQSFPVDSIDQILPAILARCDRVYYTIGTHADFDARLLGWLGELRARGGGRHTPDEIITLDHLLHDLRLYKSRAEIAALRKSARIAVQAHLRAMRNCRPEMYEYELEAEYQYEFRRHGVYCAYQPIVGGGTNACVLHYIRNDQRLSDGDLVLADVGCEFDYYASDVTRTWPVNGRFSPEQRALYELVLEAHAAAIREIRPGLHWNDPHEAAVRVITRGLVEMGLLKGEVRRLIAEGSYRRFFMHRTGHWLGMDVHDVGDYKIADNWRLLEPGMVMTVEPGIYVPESRSIPRRWRGIGIRIEDDVLVTREGHEVLTAALPVQPDALESLIGTAVR